MPQLALGTAQFGLNHGITNAGGQVPSATARELLQQAPRAGVLFIDTSQAYGNAEKVLGEGLPRPNPFRVISKLSVQAADQPFDAACEARWQQLLEVTLERLKLPQLDGLLLHAAGDLARPDGARLLHWLCTVQQRCQVRRIGVSIYAAADLEELPLAELQLVQLPCSLYDQRLIADGTVQTLLSAGIAVHARSLYLQGWLVTPPERWPQVVSPALGHHHEQFHGWAQSHGWSLVQLALAWARSQVWMEAALVGVTSAAELEELCAAWGGPDPWHGENPNAWAWPAGQDLDPRHWG
ncbi:MAG: hypothetical protein DCO99_07555 [Synechococcus sp. XM-24]|nr:MAG: hypothetical protein DCO99_07555 [Synechococcus sp. XM-24]